MANVESLVCLISFRCLDGVDDKAPCRSLANALPPMASFAFQLQLPSKDAVGLTYY
jgi:hypothetical protein